MAFVSFNPHSANEYVDIIVAARSKLGIPVDTVTTLCHHLHNNMEMCKHNK